MSETFFDKASWSRAMGPALKVIGYFSAGFVILFLVYIVLFFLMSIIGLQAIVVTGAGFLGPLIMLFYAVLVFFKVLDEELPRNR